MPRKTALPSAGKSGSAAVLHQDSTEVHQLEQRLRYQKALTEAVIDATPMVVAVLNPERKVLLDNSTYKALMADLRGTEPSDLFLDALEQQIGFDLSELCSNGKGFRNIEVRLDPPGAMLPRWFSCSGVRVDEGDGQSRHAVGSEECDGCRLLLIANEVTASRQPINDARLNLIRAVMAEHQMAQTMQEAISGAIFKLQAPLNIIKAAMSMPGYKVESGQHLVLRQALDAGEEALQCLQKALPSTPGERSSLVNINEILHEVLRLSTESLLAGGVVVDWRPTPVLPSITARANAIRGVFKYLLDNAVQAVGESSRSYREIRLETRIDDHELVVEVMDNGTGFPEALRVKAFEPFHCGWRHPAGHAGMGLTMAQEVVADHGGTVEIDPDFLGGSRIFVRLPCGVPGGRTES